MVEHSFYVGIDIDDSNAVITYYQAQMSEPETLSPIAGSEIFQIPVLLAKKKGVEQWFIGVEAERAAQLEGEKPVDKLLSRALENNETFIDGVSMQAAELLYIFIKKLLLLASRLGNPQVPDCLAISLETLSRERINLFAWIAQELGIKRSNLLLLDRKESFYYFVYNQKKELWVHSVYLFDYRDEQMKCVLIERNTRTIPQMITITETCHKMDKTNQDEGFYRILMECFKGNIVSAAYLVGDGFEGNWMNLCISYLCRGRRAFIGKNLYSKGACYAAVVREEKLPWPYVYIGENEMKVNVSLKVLTRGGEEFYSLISAGENWYETFGECEVILDGEKEVDFWLQLPHSREAKIQKLELADLPQRAPKMTRLRICARPLSDTQVKIVIQDLGFGEILKSSGQSWEYTMSL